MRPRRRTFSLVRIFRPARLGTSLGVASAALAGAAIFFLLTDGGREVRVEKSLWPRIERLSVMAGLGVDQVAIYGHVFTPDSAIYDALDLDNVRTFLALDTATVRERLGRLPWIATADLTRTYPGRVEVIITERKPFAVWRRGPEEFLIDRTGRELTRINPGSVGDLPRVAGVGAAVHFAGLMALVARFPEIARRLESSEWVAERRWTLHLLDGVTLHLPADREAPALQELAARSDLIALLGVPGRTIDVRAPARIAVREGTGQRPVGRRTGGSGT